MRKGFIVRQKSLGSLQSKQFSKTSNEFKNQKSLAITNRNSQTKNRPEEDENVQKLKVNLNYAMELAAHEAVVSSRAKEQSMRSTQTKIYVEKKYNTMSTQLYEEKDKLMKAQSKIVSLQYEFDKQKQQNTGLKQKLGRSQKDNKSLREQLKQMEKIRQKLQELELQKNRIILLQNQLRNQKLAGERMKKEMDKQNITIEELEQKVKSNKPFIQELQQRIGYLERVNLELERKMQDFHRKEHEYKKQIEHWKNSYNKMTTDRNKFRTNYQNTYKTLQQKLEYIKNLEKEIEQKNGRIDDLVQQLRQKTLRCEDLEHELRSTNEYYKSIMDENEFLKKRNKILQQFEQQNRRTLESHIKVAEETNLYIVSRNSSIAKAQNMNKELNRLIEKTEEKFTKLDKLFEEGSLRGQSEIKQSYYAVIRYNTKLILQVKELKEEFEEKVLKYGEERDILQRKVDLYSPPYPDEQNMMESIIADKTQEIIMLESSNDQLLKAKRQFEDRITTLEKENEESKKEIYLLRLKAADLFKAKKDVEEAKKTIARYQEMIEENKQSITDLNSQTEVLRNRINELSDKNFNYDLQNRNLTFKVNEYQNIMKQLDVNYLNAKKVQNEQNAHTIIDTMQKMENGINSLSYFFSCCFCGQMLSVPITLAMCGHNYCTKCKDAYAQFCYECDTGQTIEKVFQNKFLKEIISKYKFLVMIVKEAKINLVKIQI